MPSTTRELRVLRQAPYLIPIDEYDGEFHRDLTVAGNHPAR
jgi:hypothetical protein